MPLASSTWWTDQKIDATVSRHFVLDQLKPEEQQWIDRSLSFGDGLTDNTYLDWILERAKRLFLILVDIDLPDQIFGLVDESYDDGDLPIASEAVKSLKLSYHPDAAVDKRFYKTQFKFLIKSIKEGEHTYYTPGETIPVENLGFNIGLPILGGENLEKVRLSTDGPNIFAQRKISLGRRSKVNEADILREIGSLKRLRHEHLVSVYASYATQDTAFVLLTPVAEYTLKSFMQDMPKPFETLPKVTRYETIINWPHCLSNGLAWLHAHNQHHGAIRPSNIFVDNEFRIYLGQFDAYDSVRSHDKANEVEVYQYAPPEKWKRNAAVQSTGSAKVSGHSGGRTARKAPTGKSVAPMLARPNTSDSRSEGSVKTTSSAPGSLLEALTIKSGSGSSGSPPLSTISEGSVRGNTPRSPITSRAGRTSSRSQPPRSKSAKTKEVRLPFQNTPASPKTKNGISGLMTISEPSSYSSSSNHSSSNHSSNSGSFRTLKPNLPDPIAAPASDVRAAVVQTWDSDEYNSYFSDIFALGAVCIEILSFFCKRTYANFARHRSAKNRTAGRGGGLADASFHANLGQVQSWCKILEDDAKKKAKKEDKQAFAAVKPMLAILAQCIEREPEHRLQAGEVQDQLSDCIWKYANVRTLHCTSKVEAEPFTPSEDIQSPGMDVSRFDFARVRSNGSQSGDAPGIPNRNPRRLTSERRPAEVSPRKPMGDPSNHDDLLPLHYQQFLSSDKAAPVRPYIPTRSSSRQTPPPTPSDLYTHSPLAASSTSMASYDFQITTYPPDISRRPNGKGGLSPGDAHPGRLWDPAAPSISKTKLREKAAMPWSPQDQAVGRSYMANEGWI